MTEREVAVTLVVELIRKSGVNQADEPESRKRITDAAIEMAHQITARTKADQ